MPKTKKAISVLIVVVFLVNLMVPAFAETGENLPDWASTQIQAWLDKGLLKGFEDGTVKPDDFVTRAQFVAFVTRIFNLQTESEKNNFTDVASDSWYASDVSKAFNEGIVKGFSETEFGPENNITREQAATMVARAYEVVSNGSSDKAFADDDQISDWAKDAVAALKSNNYIKGEGNNIYNPKANITRAQTVVMLNNVMGDLVNESGEYSQDQKGNLVVNSGNVTLKDMTINGNLYLAQGIAKDEIVLDGVTVKGDIIVKGGGDGTGTKAAGDFKNCIIIINSSVLGQVLLMKKDGKTKLVATGESVVEDIIAYFGAELDDTTVTNGKGFGLLTILSEDEDALFTLKGDFEEVNCESEGSTVELLEGIVAKFIAAEGANGAKINIKGGTVNELIVKAAAIIDLIGGYIAKLNVDQTAADAQVNFNGANVESATILSKIIIKVLAGILNNLEVGETGAGADIEVNGGVLNSVNMKSAANLNVLKGTIMVLKITATGAGAKVQLAKDAIITFVEAMAAMNIDGEGVVSSAKIEASNVVINVVTKVFQIIGDIVASILGKEYTEDTDSGVDVVEPTVTPIPTDSTTSPTTTSPSTSPTSSTSPVSSGGNTSATAKVPLTAVKYTLNGSDLDGSLSTAKDFVTLDLTAKADTDKLSGLKFTITGDTNTANYVTSSLKSYYLGTSSVPLVKTLTASNILVSSLLGSGNGDVTVGTLRRTFGKYVYVYGKLEKSGYSNLDVTIKVDLTTKGFGDVTNEYVEVKTDGQVVTAYILKDNETTKADDIAIYSTLMALFGQIPNKISTTSSTNGFVDVSVANFSTIQDNIAALASTTWANLKLVDLVGKTIYFKKQNDSTVYTLNIAQTNDHFYLQKDGNTITATIKSGSGSEKVSALGLAAFSTDLFGGLPASINVSTGGAGYDASAIAIGSSPYTAVKTGIAGLASKDWDDVLLSDLVGKTIWFKNVGDSTVYTLVIE